MVLHTAPVKIVCCQDTSSSMRRDSAWSKSGRVLRVMRAIILTNNDEIRELELSKLFKDQVTAEHEKKPKRSIIATNAIKSDTSVVADEIDRPTILASIVLIDGVVYADKRVWMKPVILYCLLQLEEETEVGLVGISEQHPPHDRRFGDLTAPRAPRQRGRAPGQASEAQGEEEEGQQQRERERERLELNSVATATLTALAVGAF
ncbi:hypothetical protein EVAR_6933_1 [Eumeta japonica]|uniref:Uncharacterized protein n=1 Tax=Eumeta variegata TaxID=151549 RepID=A0A4C1TJ18_EUMVA|nr:hypothetical protein EVAR_6933_1 [Eumeta japonica]